MEQWIYKVCASAEWERAVAEAAWLGSPDDRRDGYIHFSTATQLAGTLAKHFAGHDDLVLVKFATAALGPALRWEPGRAGQLFPHLYGPLDPKLAAACQALKRGPDGRHELPKDLCGC
jgi:uncharacterized protein (DUF952 family)